MSQSHHCLKSKIKTLMYSLHVASFFKSLLVWMKVPIHAILHEMLPKENCYVFLNLEEERYVGSIKSV